MINWDQEVLAGPVLIRQAMQSNNFVAGATGWQVTAAGNAEFNNLTARGDFIVGSDPGQHIKMDLDGLGRPEIELSTGAVTEASPALIRTSPPALTGENFVEIIGPNNSGNPGLVPNISLITWNGSASQIVLTADDFRVNNPIILDSVWSPIILAGTWVDAAGARAQYLKDAAGTVHVRGQISGGAAVTIGNLPAGYRPTQTVQMALRSGAGAGVTSAIAFQTNGDIVVITNLAQSTPLQRLDCSFSTL